MRPSVCLSICVSVSDRFSVCLLYVSTGPSVCLSFKPVCLSDHVCLFLWYVCIYLKSATPSFVCLSVFLWNICLSVRQCVCPSAILSMRLSARPTVCLYVYVCLSVYMPINLSVSGLPCDRPAVSLFVCLYICIYRCVCVCLSVFMSLCLCVNRFIFSECFFCCSRHRRRAEITCPNTSAGTFRRHRLEESF